MTSKFLKPISYIVRGLGIFLILFTLLAFIEAFNYLYVARNYGILGFDENFTSGEDSAMVVRSVMKEYPADYAGIQAGDTITRVNGTVLNIKDYSKIFGEPLIGKPVTVTVRRNGMDKDYVLSFVSPPFYEKIIELLFRIIPALLMLAYILVGFWGVMKSPYSKVTILISLFCFCFGCFMYSTINFSVMVETFTSKYLYFRQIKSGLVILSLFATSFWLYLFATFPYRLPFLDRNKLISYIFIFLLPILVIFSAVTGIHPGGYIIIFLAFLNMALGVFLLKSNTKKVKTALEQRQIRLMFLGIKYGALAVFIGWLVILITEFIFKGGSVIVKYAGLIIFLLGEIGGLIIPFTFLNSFFQNRLLETESALKRRIRYTGVTLAMLTVYLSLIFFVGRVSVNIFNITDPTVIIIFILFVSLTFTPLNKKILKWLDDKFYPERTRYTESLKVFIQNISAYIESGELLNKLAEWVRTTTGIVTTIPVAFDNQLTYEIPFSMNDNDSVINRIRDGKKFFWDELSDRYRVSVNEKEFEWARQNDISVTIPMISGGELIGALNVGKKINSEDYTAADLDILTQASNQTALALQNIKLQSAYLEKKRMDKELEMARNIQQQLMPQSIPHVDKLEICGDSRPCHEVAGDYYDIINIENNYTVLVIADVSGKGAGAAMIMANLQASIRLGVHLSDELADFVTRVNDLIYSNTSPYEFITFFMGIWDPAKNVLYYVNAGHNAPLLIDKDNKVTQLEATGMVMGIMPNQPYEEKYVRIYEGSLLVIYTDGLEEAFNPSGEQFGQQRIIDTVIKNKDASCRSIIKALNDEVLMFTNGVPLHDDVTMIVAKGMS
jgi:serine phosphatase RsbU (regulator of sigma subunit)